MPTEGSNSVSSLWSSLRRPTKLCVSGGRLPGPPPVDASGLGRFVGHDNQSGRIMTGSGRRSGNSDRRSARTTTVPAPFDEMRSTPCW